MDGASKRLCMYCGKPTGRVRKGEHLVPDAIGGTIATKDVCPRCNNALSDIDRELCSRSPLSFVAAKEIEGHVWQAWDVDERSGTLLEGCPDFERSGFMLYPQIIIMRDGEQFWADYEQLRNFGVDRFHVFFARRLRKAFWEYEHGNKKAIRLSRKKGQVEKRVRTICWTENSSDPLSLSVVIKYEELVTRWTETKKWLRAIKLDQ